MESVPLPVAGAGVVLVALITWVARTLMDARRVDRVDGVEAISKAYERLLAGHDAQVELLKSLVGEQSKRIDALQTLVSAKDAALAERDTVIRRLREHLDVYYHALIEARVPHVPPPPDVPLAPERRSPDAAAKAAPIVEAARHAEG
jgi:cellobiose-specific phosphotransferase system component IIA